MERIIEAGMLAQSSIAIGDGVIKSTIQQERVGMKCFARVQIGKGL